MDLTTTYMGLTLKNPLVPSASPLSKNLDSIKQLEDAGASAIVMYSVFDSLATKLQTIFHPTETSGPLGNGYSVDGQPDVPTVVPEVVSNSGQSR